MNSKTTLRKLAAYGLGIGGCGALMAGNAGAEDASIEVTFGFGSTLNSNSPAADGSTNYGKILTEDVLGNTVAAGVGNFSWTAIPANRTALDGTTFGSSATQGFYHDGVFGANNGKVVYESNTAPHTFGTGSLPSVGRNQASFDNFYSGGDLGHDATGVVGFLSSAGNWGYVEFDWTEATSTLMVLSAKIQRHPFQPIDFTPTAIVGATVPEPSSMVLLTMGASVVCRRRNKRRSA